MKQISSAGRRMLAWFLVLLVAGCGGGGGGAPGVSGTASGSGGAVAVGAPTPAKISATKVVGDSLGTIKLSGVVSGDVESLQGKPVTIVVEDPSRLFNATGYLTLERTVSGWTYSLELGGQPLTASGHLTGSLKVFACVDTGCKQPLAGMPLIVPYDVTVEEGLALSREEVTVTVPFGTKPAPETVNVDWSHTLSKGYVINNTTRFDPYVPTYVSFSQPAGQLVTASQLQLLPQLAPPGSYTETVELRSSAAVGPMSSRDFVKTITVHYNVTPNPSLDYVVFPAGSIELTQSASDQAIRYYNYRLVLNTGVTASYLGVDYLGGAGTKGPATSWWDEFPYNGSYHSCVNYTDCLAPGLYTAQVRYRITSSRGSYDVAVPLRLTVTP